LSDDVNDIVYRTGDLGRMMETGEIEFAGRRDRQVKINGVRIELAEVESLFREHPGVQDVAIVDRQGISGSSELIAYMVLQPKIATDELRRFLLDRAQPGMLPSHFVLADSLPRTASGKLNYAELPEPDIAADDSPFVAPQTPLEQAVAAIWTDLLQIDTLSIDAHFFRVGWALAAGDAGPLPRRGGLLGKRVAARLPGQSDHSRTGRAGSRRDAGGERFG